MAYDDESGTPGFSKEELGPDRADEPLEDVAGVAAWMECDPDVLAAVLSAPRYDLGASTAVEEGGRWKVQRWEAVLRVLVSLGLEIAGPLGERHVVDENFFFAAWAVEGEWSVDIDAIETEVSISATRYRPKRADYQWRLSGRVVPPEAPLTPVLRAVQEAFAFAWAGRGS
jgi:hypothetical protein